MVIRVDSSRIENNAGNVYSMSYLGSLLLAWINSITAWANNYIHYIMWDEITPPNFNGDNGNTV